MRFAIHNVCRVYQNDPAALNGQGGAMTSTTQDQADQKHHEEKLLHVTVFSPRTPEPRHYTWDCLLYTSDAADE